MSLPSCDLKVCDFVCSTCDSVLTLCVPLPGGGAFTMFPEDGVSDQNENSSGYLDIHREAELSMRHNIKISKVVNGK